MNDAELINELTRCVRQVNSQIEEIRQEAVRTHTPPVTMKDSNGNYIWAPLVAAKAQALHAIALITRPINPPAKLEDYP